MMLTFGYNAGLVEGLRAAWGARWIVTQDGSVDHVWDRASWAGTEDEQAALEFWLNKVVGRPGDPDASPFRAAREAASRMLAERIISTRDDSPCILYQDGKGAIVANTNASAGYLYVAGYLYEHLPEGHPTLGLEKVIDALAAKRAAARA